MNNFLFNIIDIEHANYWIKDLVINSGKIQQGEALAHEASVSLPVSVFIEEDTIRRDAKLKTGDQYSLFGDYNVTGYITFLDADNNPSYTDEEGRGGMHWFKLEMSYRRIAVQLMCDIIPMPTTINGISGWLVGLYENEVLNDFEDTNAYFHNIMLWESMIAPREAGPIIQRITWLAEHIMSLHRSMNKGIEAIRKANIGLNFEDLETFETTIKKLLDVMEEREQEIMAGLTEEEKAIRGKRGKLQQLQERIDVTKRMIESSNVRIERAQEKMAEAQRLQQEGETRRENFERKLARLQEEMDDLIKSIEQ